MITRKAIAAVLCGIFLSGCATGYHSQDSVLSGFTGGYSESQGPGELTHVVFNGNGFIKKEKVSLYLLYRCAELAQQKGKPYFTMFASISHAIANRPLSESFATTVGGKPTSSVYILLDDTAAPNSLSAADVLAKYGPEINAGSTP